MIRLSLTTAVFTLSAAFALAQQGNPGAHFLENWDFDEDGQVTLAEATERRGDIFVTFDSDDDGILSGAEYDLFDQARANDMRENGMGHGNGPGKKGMNPANGMKREFTDANGDGQVTHDEFMASVSGWYGAIDKNADGTVTAEDFARRGN